MPKDKTDYILLGLSALIFVFALLVSSHNRKEESVLAASAETPLELEYWNGFLEQNPTYFEGWIEIANIYAAQGNVKAASEAFKEAEKIKPNSTTLSEVKIPYP